MAYSLQRAGGVPTTKPTVEANVSKQAKKGDTKVQVKKGAIINRRNNRTINQDVAHSDPKWVDMGGGVLKHRKSKSFITLQGGKFVSLTRKQVDIALAPKEAPEVVEEKKAA